MEGPVLLVTAYMTAPPELFRALDSMSIPLREAVVSRVPSLRMGLWKSAILVIDSDLTYMAAHSDPKALSRALMWLRDEGVTVRGLVLEDSAYEFVQVLRELPKIEVAREFTLHERCTAAALSVRPGATIADECFWALAQMPVEESRELLRGSFDDEGGEWLEVWGSYVTDKARLLMAVRWLWARGRLDDLLADVRKATGRLEALDAPEVTQPGS